MQQKDEAPLCACGCEEKVNWNKKYYRWNKIIWYHGQKGKKSPNYGNDKYTKEKAKSAPLCACRCGEKVIWSKWRGKWNKFIYAHYKKGSSGRDKYAQEKAKGAPFCACGICKEKTKWNINTRKYNSHVHGHNNKEINSYNWKGGIGNYQKITRLSKKWKCTIEQTQKRCRKLFDNNIIQTVKEIEQCKISANM